MKTLKEVLLYETDSDSLAVIKVGSKTRKPNSWKLLRSEKNFKGCNDGSIHSTTRLYFYNKVLNNPYFIVYYKWVDYHRF